MHVREMVEVTTTCYKMFLFFCMFHLILHPRGDSQIDIKFMFVKENMLTFDETSGVKGLTC